MYEVTRAVWSLKKPLRIFIPIASWSVSLLEFLIDRTWTWSRFVLISGEYSRASLASFFCLLWLDFLLLPCCLLKLAMISVGSSFCISDGVSRFFSPRLKFLVSGIRMTAIFLALFIRRLLLAPAVALHFGAHTHFGSSVPGDEKVQ